MTDAKRTTTRVPQPLRGPAEPSKRHRPEKSVANRPRQGRVAERKREGAERRGALPFLPCCVDMTRARWDAASLGPRIGSLLHKEVAAARRWHVAGSAVRPGADVAAPLAARGRRSAPWRAASFGVPPRSCCPVRLSAPAARSWRPPPAPATARPAPSPTTRSVSRQLSPCFPHPGDVSGPSTGQRGLLRIAPALPGGAAGGTYSAPRGDQRAGKPDERTVPLSVCVASCVAFSGLAAVVVAVACSMPMP